VLTNDETKRLKQAILAAIASPLIGSIEDYSWEAIFHYRKFGLKPRRFTTAFQALSDEEMRR
jgi:hypothetical protein